ncbi:MAG: 1-acyl-sn-glycerol-3-phosphate acyltransferase, partial [Lentimonas sp.]
MSQKKRGKSTYRYTALAMKVLEKVLGSKIIIKGLENIPPKPVLFVCNHFTRSETFVVPYIIYKYTNRQVRCLADNGLFVGILGRFLKSVGTISTKDAKRDRIIISDLVTGNYDWMIYPEGSMIKSKEINRSVVRSTYLLGNHKDQRGQKKVRTGSAILGLKSEIYRTDLIDAHSKNHEDVLRRYKKELGVEFDSSLKNLNTHIVPVNITYYPIRPGKNIIQKIAGRLFKKLPKIISEELEIEGNLLMGANINISFGKAINLSDNIKKVRKVIYKIPIIGPETKVNMVLKYLKYNLTNQFMKEIYSGTRVNFDHLFVAILYFYPKEDIEITHLKKLIY